MTRPELIARAKRTTAYLDTWLQAEGSGRRDLFLAPAHVRALAEAMRSVAPHVTSDTTDVDAITAVVRAEEVAHLVRHIVATRRDAEVGARLQLADLCAADGYAAALTATGHGEGRWTPPIVIPEAATSALTYPRDAAARSPSVAGAKVPVDLRVPVVLFPPDQLFQPWTYTTLQHEVGHDLAVDFNLNDGARDVVAALLPDDLTPKPPERPDVARWAMELLADTIAVVLSGPAFAVSLARVLSDLGGPGPSALYPGAADRIAFNRAVIVALGDPMSAAVDAELSTAVPGRVLDHAVVAELAAALLDLPVPWGAAEGLLEGDAEVEAPPDVAPRVRDLGGDRAAFHRAVDALVTGVDAPTDAPWRALPAAAQLRLPRDADADAIAAVTDWLLTVSAGAAQVSWTREPEQWAFLSRAFNELDPSFRVDGKKVLSNRLLTQHDRVAFVGATQTTLPIRLRDGLGVRNGQRWSQIEVFVLTPAQLRRLYPHDADAHIARAEEVVAQLTALLPAVADAWAIYRYDTPWMFASYWDWDALHGRIHTSSQIWGQDLASVPGIDLIRTGTPSPEYLTLVEGLLHLRAEAARVAGGAVSAGGGAAPPPLPPAPPAPPPSPPDRRPRVRLTGSRAHLIRRADPVALAQVGGAEDADPILAALKARLPSTESASVERYDIVGERGPLGLTGAREAPALTIDVEPGEHVLVLTQDADGLRWEAVSGPEAGHVDVPLQARIIAPDGGPAGPAGLFGQVWGTIRTWIVRRVVNLGVRALVEHLDGPIGPRLLDMTPAAPDAWVDVPPDAPAPHRLLLFVHGTGSSTRGSFRGLAGAPLAALAASYDAVWGFEHATLSRTPADNAAELAAALAARVGAAPLEIDVVSFSRGGLVTTCLLADELRRHPAWQVRRAVFVACPLMGTELARGQRWLDYANALTDAAGLALLAPTPLAAGFELLGWTGDLVLALSAAALDPDHGVVPGVEAMDPGGDFVNALATRIKDIGAPPTATAITANFTALTAAALTRAVLFGGRPNDLVVDVPSMEQAPGTPTVHRVPEASGVYHLTYFRDLQVQAWLAAALRRP